MMSGVQRNHSIAVFSQIIATTATFSAEIFQENRNNFNHLVSYLDETNFCF